MPSSPIRLPASLRGLPAAFWWLWLGTFVNRLGTFVLPFLALYVTEGRGFDESVASRVLLAWGVALLPAPAVGGSLTDRIGRLPTLAIATVAGAIATIGLGLARTEIQLIGAAALLGLFGEMYRPATSALLADVVPPADRPRAFGLQFWAINLGFAVATAGGGLLAQVDWFLLFAGDAATMLLFGGIVVWRVQEPDRPTAPTDPHADGRTSMRRVLSDRLFLAILGTTVLTALVYAQVQSTLSVYVVSQGLTTAQYGTLIALNGVVIALVQPLAVSRVSRLRPGIGMAIGEAILALGIGATALAAGWGGFAVTVVVWTLGEIVTSIFRVPIVADISPDDMRGRYQGWFGFSFAVAFAIGPSLGLFVLDHLGTALWWGAMVVAMVSAGWWLLLRSAIAERRAMSLGLPETASS